MTENINLPLDNNLTAKSPLSDPYSLTRSKRTGRLKPSRMGIVTNDSSELTPFSLTDIASYRELEISYDPRHRAIWSYMRPEGKPSFTHSILRELNRLHHTLACYRAPPHVAEPLYYILGSRLQGIFNLGGDLALMIERIRAGDEATLRSYAYDCIEAVHTTFTGFGRRIITIALVEGSALGGGLEAALSFNVMIAERGVKMGFPEVLFGSFPGMGAISFLSRKLGLRTAEAIISSGKTYCAEEFHEMGLVDILVEPGQGRQAVEDYMLGNRSRYNVSYSLAKARQLINDIPLQELKDITDLWVQTALSLDANDLRRMEKLVKAQTRQSL